MIDRGYLLRIGETYHEALREQELEIDQLTQELESTRGFLRGTQTTLQESESRSEELLEDIHFIYPGGHSDISFGHMARGCWWSSKGAPVDGGPFHLCSESS
jgi:hypothetical protein